MANAKIDYGIDAPPVIRNLLIIGSALLILSLIDVSFVRFLKLPFRVGSANINLDLRGMFLGTGALCLVEAVLMLIYAKFGKFRHRDRMLGMINWRGDETVLDVGTGRGLLLIGAAKRLTSGKAYGIDIFNAADLSGNKLENIRRNVELEGVASKIEIKEDDARRLSFPDETFDVVLSNLCLHNIPDKEGRKAACREIARVLKPHGTAVLSDYKSNKLYQSVFKELGCKPDLSFRAWFDTFPPLKILKVEKVKE